MPSFSSDCDGHRANVEQRKFHGDGAAAGLRVWNDHEQSGERDGDGGRLGDVHDSCDCARWLHRYRVARVHWRGAVERSVFVGIGYCDGTGHVDDFDGCKFERESGDGSSTEIGTANRDCELDFCVLLDCAVAVRVRGEAEAAACGDAGVCGGYSGGFDCGVRRRGRRWELGADGNAAGNLQHHDYWHVRVACSHHHRFDHGKLADREAGAFWL